MKKFKLLIVGIFGLMLWGSYSFGAYLSVSPREGTVGKNCIQDFDLSLDMLDGEEGLAFEIILQSNMEFLGFKKSDIFEYLMPYYNDENGLHIRLLNYAKGNISVGGILGKLYYKVVGDDDPYIDFYFLGKGNTVDTSLFLDGSDILDGVNGGKYELADDKMCEENTSLDVEFTEQTMEEFLDQFEKDVNKSNDNIVVEDKNMINWYLIGFIVLLVFLVIIILAKKGKK